MHCMNLLKVIWKNKGFKNQKRIVGKEFYMIRKVETRVLPAMSFFSPGLKKIFFHEDSTRSADKIQKEFRHWRGSSSMSVILHGTEMQQREFLS